MKKFESLIEDLKKANKKLKEAVKAKPTRMNKDATLHRFEFTFELSWKTIQEWVKDNGLVCKSPKDCFRLAAQLDLIEKPQVWFDFLKYRNLVAHTYNEKIADKIYRQAIKFPSEIDNLLEKIKSRER